MRHKSDYRYACTCKSCGQGFLSHLRLTTFCPDCGPDQLTKQLRDEDLQRDQRIANAKLMRERKREDLKALGLDPDNPEPKEWKGRD